jgi:hypothetical protein
MERDPAAEFGLGQPAAAEFLEEGLPAEIEGAVARHDMISRRDHLPSRYDHRRESRGLVVGRHRTDTDPSLAPGLKVDLEKFITHRNHHVIVNM